jgi:hypothetical protein
VCVGSRLTSTTGFESCSISASAPTTVATRTVGKTE